MSRWCALSVSFLFACETGPDATHDACAASSSPQTPPRFVVLSECVDIEASEMNLGVAVNDGEAIARTLRIKNNCEVSLEGSVWIDTNVTEFKVIEDKGTIEYLDIGEERTYTLTFAPKRPSYVEIGSGMTQLREGTMQLNFWPSFSLYGGEVEFQSGKFEIELTATAFEPRCPIPVISKIVHPWGHYDDAFGWPYDDLLIIGKWDHLELRGEGSYGFNGDVINWHWMVVDAPEALTPQERQDIFSHEESETQYVQLPRSVCGVYTLGLEVTDVYRRSCAPALMTVQICSGTN